MSTRDREERAQGVALREQQQTPSAPEGDLHAAWRDFSRLVQTLIVRQVRRERAKTTPDDPFPKGEVPDHLPKAAAPSGRPSAAAHPLSHGEGHGA